MENRVISTQVMSDEVRDWVTKASVREWGEEDARSKVEAYKQCKNGTPLPAELPDDCEDEDALDPAQQVTLSMEFFCGNYPANLRYPEDWADFEDE